MRGGAPPHTGAMPHTTVSAAPTRVFVVEDSPLIRARLEAMVTLAGAEAAGHASGAAAATRAILEMRPEIVLLDIDLAEGSGFDVLRARSGRRRPRSTST